MTPIMTMKPGVPIRRKRTVDISIDERPKRKTHIIANFRARKKFIDQIENIIRGSMEYKECVEFIKKKMNRSMCYVNPAIQSANGKKYTIELHHEPFTLFDLVDVEIARREMEGEPLDKFDIARSVMELHYLGLVGLIPLSKTQHELVHKGKVFIPLQHVYEDFYGYYTKFADVIESEACTHIKNKIDAKIQLSLKCGDIQTNVEPEFTYVNVGGFDFPCVPDEWQRAVNLSTELLAEEEAAKEKAEKKAAKEAKKK